MSERMTPDMASSPKPAPATSTPRNTRVDPAERLGCLGLPATEQRGERIGADAADGRDQAFINPRYQGDGAARYPGDDIAHAHEQAFEKDQTSLRGIDSRNYIMSMTKRDFND